MVLSIIQIICFKIKIQLSQIQHQKREEQQKKKKRKEKIEKQGLLFIKCRKKCKLFHKISWQSFRLISITGPLFQPLQAIPAVLTILADFVIFALNSTPLTFQSNFVIRTLILAIMYIWPILVVSSSVMAVFDQFRHFGPNSAIFCHFDCFYYSVISASNWLFQPFLADPSIQSSILALFTILASFVISA